MSAQDVLRTAFEPIRGLPGWRVHRGHGSFVTFEFGAPRVEVHDVRTRPLKIAGERFDAPRRGAYVHGEWHLWIYCCEWSLSWCDRQIAHSESPDAEIDSALLLLNGQSVTTVEAGSPDGRSSFAFDLDCVLSTQPYDDSEQWMFFQPSGDVLTLRADGRLVTGPGNEPRP
jgi:hypothetical protein